MAIIKYKDKDGNLLPLGATGDHSHSLESLGAAKKDHPHELATMDNDGFMSVADKVDIQTLNDTVFGNDDQQIPGLVDLVGSGVVEERLSVLQESLKEDIEKASTDTKTAANKYTDDKITDLSEDTSDTLGKITASVKKNSDDISALDNKKADANHPHADLSNAITELQNGKVPTTRTVNGKALDKDITLSYTDVGAAIEGHSHDGRYYTEAEVDELFNNKVGDGTVQEQLSEAITDCITGLSVNGKTITYTRSDGETGTITTQDTNTTYSAGTGISLSSDNKFSNSGVRSVSEGGKNGTIQVNTNGSSANIPVHGLGSAAYTDSTAYAAASHGNHVPTIQTANNAKFLRNDNTWQTVTPANIGAAESGHTHTASEVGAAGSTHSHSEYASKGSVSAGDFNNITTPGIYTVGATSTNRPPDTSETYFTLIVGNSTSGSSYVQQLAIVEGTWDMYLRHCYSGTWKEWKRLALSEEVNNSSASIDVFSASANGLVPKPDSTGTNKFLNASGSWSIPYAIQASNTTDKRFLTGTDDQSGNAYTSSNVNCYMKDGRLYSSGNVVISSDMMQSGAITVTSIGAGLGELVDRTFTNPYVDIPYFVVSSNAYNHNISVLVASLTKNGFTLKVNNTGSSTASDVRISWIAVGTPA